MRTPMIPPSLDGGTTPPTPPASGGGTGGGTTPPPPRTPPPVPPARSGGTGGGTPPPPQTPPTPPPAGSGKPWYRRVPGWIWVVVVLIVLGVVVQKTWKSDIQPDSSDNPVATTETAVDGDSSKITVNSIVNATSAFTAIVVLPILLVSFLLASAKQGWHAKFLPNAEVGFVVAGQKLVRVICNVPGYFVRETEEPGKDPGWEIVRESPEFPAPYENIVSRSLKKWFGLYWVSLIYPFRSLHTFTIDKAKLMPTNQLKELTPDKWITIEKGKEVNTLRWKFTRPFVAMEVELRDKIRTTIALTGVFKVIDPVRSVFVYKGNFFDFLTNTVVSEVTEFFRNDNFNEFVARKKSTGELGVLMARINEIIERVLGITCEEIGVVEFTTPQADQKALEAAQGVEIAENEAKAAIARARGKAAEAAAPVKGVLDALREVAGGNPELLAHLMRSQSIQHHQGPLSLGGDQGFSVLVDGGSTPKSKDATEAEASGSATPPPPKGGKRTT